MSPNQLTKLGINADKWYKPLMDTFVKYNISTTKRQAAFIGQCQHETGNFTRFEENLNYSPERLMVVWPSRFPDMATAMKYARNPQLLANKVYSGRMGNSSESDGYAYRGRGIIQLTGKELYANCGSGIGVDLIGHPDWLLDPKYSALAAGWFWNKKGLNDLADSSDIDTMTKRINGGLTGLNDRKAKIAHAQQVLDTQG